MSDVDLICLVGSLIARFQLTLIGSVFPLFLEGVLALLIWFQAAD